MAVGINQTFSEATERFIRYRLDNETPALNTYVIHIVDSDEASTNRSSYPSLSTARHKEKLDWWSKSFTNDRIFTLF